MKADIGFFQEQQPNGKIADSEMRLLVSVPMIMAFLYLIGSLYMYHLEINKLLLYLHDKVITEASYIAMRNSLSPVNWIILGSLITLALGGKLYQKGQENSALADEQDINSGKDTTKNLTTTTTTDPPKPTTP